MNIVAIVLAGGRSSRLGGVPKAGLIVGGRTLLQRTLDAVADAREVVVVGDVVVPRQAVSVRPPLASAVPLLPGTARSVLVTRESPPFAGPAAAIAAGVDALAASGDISDDLVLVLACDMPEVGAAVGLLLEAAEALLAEPGRPVSGAGDGDVDGFGDGDGAVDGDGVGDADGVGDGVGVVAVVDGVGDADGVVAVDADGRRQVLAGIYRGSALIEAITRAEAEAPLAGLSVRKLFAELVLIELAVPESATADIDTWADARAFGAAIPGAAGEGAGSDSELGGPAAAEVDIHAARAEIDRGALAADRARAPQRQEQKR
jgi:CTP:molybdopterin cytidylyltransferase MocA